jgi:hypothetical protein
MIHPVSAQLVLGYGPSKKSRVGPSAAPEPTPCSILLDATHDRRRPIPFRRAATISPRLELATQVLTGLALLGALQFHLLASLLAGLLVYQLVHSLAPGHNSRFVRRRTGKIIVVALLAILVIAAIGARSWGSSRSCRAGPRTCPFSSRKWPR